MIFALGLLLFGLVVVGRALVACIIIAICVVLDFNTRLKQRTKRHSNDLEPQPIAPLKGVST